MRKYDFVIVLSASPRNGDGSFDETSPNPDDKDTELYLGGQIRMQAALDLCKKVDIGKIVVVGGSEEKVCGMKEFLTEGGIPKEKIVRVISKPDTYGNMWAIHKTLAEKFREKTVGVLTNFYHIPRAMRFISDPQFEWNTTRFIPICAESVIESGELNPDPEKFMRRISKEQDGLRAWESGDYGGQKEAQSKWVGEIYDDHGFI